MSYKHTDRSPDGDDDLVMAIFVVVLKRLLQ